ncbi:hypothetical protein PoB_006799000 [Plakobranchus ocellatus]|uniref:Uncharacterized protein n=1 Tax=Plakobranchus ocellatus TaxID=259542 RepID=A0AAV4DBL1_9GAST|nr:hypothetical protein PoB_006799000 [Plakobranchus ocellatus]
MLAAVTLDTRIAVSSPVCFQPNSSLSRSRISSGGCNSGRPFPALGPQAVQGFPVASAHLVVNYDVYAGVQGLQYSRKAQADFSVLIMSNEIRS